MKANYKRALKAMARMEKNIYFDVLDNVVLVSESHFIISVPYTDWQELVEGTENVFKKNKVLNSGLLREIFIDNKDGVQCKMTNAAIYCGDKLTRVFKSNDSLGVVNEKFLDVIRDTMHADYLANNMIVKAGGSRIKTPIIYADFCDDKLISGIAVLPIIHCDIREVFNRILE